MINTSNTSTILRYADIRKRSRFRMGRSVILSPRIITSFSRFSLRFSFIVLAAGFFFSTIWSDRVFSRSEALAASTENLSLFADGNGNLPKTSFYLGEKVWAIETGTPLGIGFRERRFQWVAPDGSIVRQADITTNAQTDMYAIPASGHFAQVGTWMVKTVDNSNSGFAIVQFAVHDPANASVDLSVNVFGPSQAAAGNNITYKLQVVNNGPDDAQNVQLTDVVSGYVTFQSQTTPDDWSCTGAETMNCTIASLPKGATTSFTLVYHANDDLANNKTIYNKAEISSQTNELHRPDNTSIVTTIIRTPACKLGCRDNITQPYDQGTNGAIVAYTDPTTSTGNCSPEVTCTPPSGSFFHAGTTTVVCSTQNDGDCSFTVTVTGTMAIMLEGPDPLFVECHDEFKEPGATARDDKGDTFPVTSSAQETVDLNKPGTYTITYTATNGATTVTTTRAVTVVDTTPPVINLIGPNPLRVQRGTTFIDPGATALDACAGSKQVIASGTVDTNTTGIYTITYAATDGTNSGKATRTVIVPYDFTGFLPPINNPTTLNVAQAGRAISVKFSLGGNKGLDIFAPGYPRTVMLGCNSANPVSDIKIAVTTGDSSLSYDSTIDQYTYSWKTEEALARTCHQLIIKLNDETEHRANFKFR